MSYLSLTDADSVAWGLIKVATADGTVVKDRYSSSGICQ